MSAHPFQVASIEELRVLTLNTLQNWQEHLWTTKLHIPKMLAEICAVPGRYVHIRSELFLQLSGETRFIFPEEETIVKPGELCIVPKGLPHQERVRALDTPFATLVFLPSNNLRFHIAYETTPGLPASVFGDILEGVHERCSALMDEAIVLFHNGHRTGETGARGALTALFSLLTAALDKHSTPPNGEHPKVALARQLVFFYLHEPTLTVASIASRVQANPDHLSRLFKSAVGATLQAYILEQRLTRAMELLKSSNLNVSEVSHVVGFRDAAYFGRAFRRWAGCTPREVWGKDNDPLVAPKRSY